MAKQKTTPEADKSGDSEKKNKTVFDVIKDFGVMIVVAVTLAMTIKFLLVEVFVIPSGSMEPTLHGRVDGGDRVFCTKVNYLWREPRRWEIFVFEFPYKEALERGSGSVNKEYNGQNFIKRCIGLPGERIRISRGDIYVEPPKEAGFSRAIKNDRIQRGLWIPVYEEDFSDIDSMELLCFWKSSGDGAAPPDKDGPSNWQVTDRGTLEVSTASKSNLIFWPRAPSAGYGSDMNDCAGIPDRYVLRQAIIFKCLEPDCKKNFTKTVWTQKIAGHCPHCGHYNLENAVTHYWRRSDLPIVGPLFGAAGRMVLEGSATSKEPGGREAADRVIVSQGEQAGVGRRIDYHAVPDLRIMTKLKTEAATIIFTLIDKRDGTTERASAVLRVTPERSTAQLLANDIPVTEELEIDFPAGKMQGVEFYAVDGEARLFTGEAKHILTCQLKKPDDVPSPLDGVQDSEVMLSVANGTVEFDDLQIDRDIYYFCGLEDHIESTEDSTYSQMRPGGRFKVEEGEYMAMGDNCPSSNDSRNWGAVPLANRRGPALFVWWPLHRIKLLTIPEK